MVCNRCKTRVKTELENIGIQYNTIKIGEVNTNKEITPSQRSLLNDALKKNGFELIDKSKNTMIETLKNTVLDLGHYSNEDLNTSFSDFISHRLKDNFISLNTLFAEIEGISIEKYIIKYKIERVKELLVYDGLNLAEIALKMHYSNTAQLSSQFKKITGLTPTHFKLLRQARFNKIEMN